MGIEKKRLVRQLIRQLGTLYSEELKIKLESKKEGELFKWFLASLLFGKRIGIGIAKKTYKEFLKRGYTTPKAILKAGWDRLVEALDAGGYVRYDFSTATRLLEISRRLLSKYGSLSKLKASCKNEAELVEKLTAFKGVGNITAAIFLRELRHVWKINPPTTGIIKKEAKKLGIPLEKYRKSTGKTKEFARLEAALLRHAKEKTKKRKIRQR